MEQEEEIFYWYYRSDDDPMSFKSTGVVWEIRPESELIEVVYNDYLSVLNYNRDDIKDFSSFILDESNCKLISYTTSFHH